LKEICQTGKLKSQKKLKIVEGLEQYGVIFARSTPLWKNEGKMLNYELQTGKNCKNLIATEDDLKSY
jgi:hypothetical protein